MTKSQTHRISVAVVAGLLVGAVSLGWAKWEKEQVALENQLTERIESILSKTLPPSSYLVTVKVELEANGPGGVQRNVNKRGGENPFLKKNRFVLPGVPEKKQFNTTPEVREESTIVNQPVESMIKRMLITVLLAAVLWVGYTWTQTRYYVGTADNKVAIYNGVSQSLGPIRLSDVTEQTDIPVDSLPEYQRNRVQGTIPAKDLLHAEQIVEDLRGTARVSGCGPEAPAAGSTPAPTASASDSPTAAAQAADPAECGGAQ